MDVLLRMLDVTGGEIAPLEFVAAAERYRLMASVDRWVVQTTLTALSRNAFQLAQDRSVAINISAQTLGDPLFLEFVVECLDRTGVAPDQVCFEITESAVIAIWIPRAASSASCTAWAANSPSMTSAWQALFPAQNLPLDSPARRLVHAQSGAGFGEPDHGDRDDRARAHSISDHRRAGGRQCRARRGRKMGVDFVQGFVIARPAKRLSRRERFSN
jgi:hypothetical protein